MKKNSGVIGVEVLVGALLAGLVSFYATRNYQLEKQNKEILLKQTKYERSVIKCLKDKSNLADYIKLFVPEYIE